MQMIKFFVRQSIYVKLIALLMLVAGLAVLITSAVLSAYELERMSESENQRLQSVAEILEPHLTATILFDDDETAKELIEPLMMQSNIFRVAVFDKSNQEFASTDVHEEKIEQAGQLAKIISTPLLKDGSYYGKLVIFADNSAEEEHTGFYIGFLITILASILSVSFILSAWLGRRFVRPIITLAETANEITSSNNYSLRAQTQAQDELGDLTRCFNDMLEKIEVRDQTLESEVYLRTAELKVANEKLQDQAYKDSLSGLPNRRYMLELMNQMIDAKELDVGFAILFLDLDGFKEVNDTMGHEFGDNLIVAVAKRLQRSVRIQDTIARLGGDEFTILVNGITEQSRLKLFAFEVLRELQEPFTVNGEKLHISASIGISTYPNTGKTTEELMKNADLAMYEAKAGGRDGYRFFEPAMLTKIQHKRQVLDDLRVAVERDELELYFQPIINLRTGKTEKAEALIRWNHPVKGLVSPVEFIPIAEEHGLINKIGSWVASQSIDMIKDIRAKYSPNFSLSFNVSPVQLKKGSDWLGIFIEAVANANLGEKALLVEITENVLMESDFTSLHHLMSVRGMGVDVAIDDFGVGYSSLSYLQKLEVDTLKIDRTFIQQMNDEHASATLCKTMVNMAKNLDIKVVAEGVELKEQADQLIEFGCDYAQGYLFDRPLPRAKFEAMLQAEYQEEKIIG